MESEEPFFSLTEWQVMSAVWELEEAEEANASSVAQILGLRCGRPYSERTAGILLARLVKKGYLRSVVANPLGAGRPAHVYAPVLSREHGIRLQFKRFLQDHSIAAHETEILESILAQYS